LPASRLPRLSPRADSALGAAAAVGRANRPVVCPSRCVGWRYGHVRVSSRLAGADRRQRAAVEPVIEAARRDLYPGGWAFPERPFNWALYVFYGGDIREAELPWLREQVEAMAALPAVDDDGDLPAGLFVISDERAAVSVWEVRDGIVRDRPAPELSWVLRE
jgi:hypothetical protein